MSDCQSASAAARRFLSVWTAANFRTIIAGRNFCIANQLGRELMWRNGLTGLRGRGMAQHWLSLSPTASTVHLL